MKQPRAFLLFIEAILQLFPIVSSEYMSYVLLRLPTAVTLGEVCHDLWQAVFHRVTMALTDPGILSATPLVLPMISILRIALKNKKLQQLTVIIVTELCQLYHKVPFKLSSSDQMFVLSSLSNKVCNHGNILSCDCSMAHRKYCHGNSYWRQYCIIQ